MMLRHDQMPPIPETPRPLPDGPLYFVGVGGAGMSSLAQVLAERGRDISGADPGISTVVRARLEKVGVRVFAGHDASQLPEGVGAVVVSDAVPETNPEVQAAQARNVPIFRRPEVLGALVNSGGGIAIAGTHGKTTTTGMVASILLAANLDPTIILGGDLPAIGGNARNGKHMVVAESCEAYDGFLYLHPHVAVVLNIEADHLDYHGTEQHVFDSFKRFLKQVQNHGQVIACIDDPKTAGFVQRLGLNDPWFWYSREWSLFTFADKTRNGGAAGVHILTYGLSETADVRAVDVDVASAAPTFTIASGEYRTGPIRLQVPGLHNVQNAVAAALAARHVGVGEAAIVAGLEAFTGTGRRFEKLGEKKRRSGRGRLRAPPDRTAGDAFRRPKRVPQPAHRGRVSAAFAVPNPRQYGRFRQRLNARRRRLFDRYLPGPRSRAAGVSSEILAARVKESKPELSVVYVPDKADLPARLADEVKEGDLVLTLGAGDIRAAGEGLLNRL